MRFSQRRSKQPLQNCKDSSAYCYSWNLCMRVIIRFWFIVTQYVKSTSVAGQTMSRCLSWNTHPFSLLREMVLGILPCVYFINIQKWWRNWGLTRERWSLSCLVQISCVRAWHHLEQQYMMRYVWMSSETCFCRHEVTMDRELQTCIWHQHHLRPCQPICTAFIVQACIQLRRKHPTPHCGQRHICRENWFVACHQHWKCYINELIRLMLCRQKQASQLRSMVRAKSMPWQLASPKCPPKKWEKSTKAMELMLYTIWMMAFGRRNSLLDLLTLYCSTHDPMLHYHVLVDRAFLNFTMFFVSLSWGSDSPRAW